MKAISVGYAMIGLGFYVVLASFIFWLAGSRSLPFFYAVFASQMLVSLIGSFSLSPELLNERVKPGGKDRDPVGTPILASLWCLQLAAAAMDVGHWHIGSSVPPALQVIAVFVMTLAWFGCLWAMQANFFFSSAIRLQEDRGQQVVAAGPYAWIRHPGYAFASLGLVSEGLALGSWLTLLPTAFMVAYLFYRTLLEERMLHPGLEGYGDYSSKVRFKWIPGVW
ncbi:MAG: isoprenylcysteine carboxylmethyltransferase family protein [Cyanobacteria bacterium REEB67]|nr:isoprenylcysteine carboxylmethyltransferase family protein [Cyanobacteria bacterium REEB67]